MQAADPVADMRPLVPESATTGSIPGADGRSAWRDREISVVFRKRPKNDAKDRFSRRGKNDRDAI